VQPNEVANYTDTGLQEQSIQQFQPLDGGFEDPTTDTVGPDLDSQFENPFMPIPIPAANGSIVGGQFGNPITITFSPSSAPPNTVPLTSFDQWAGMTGSVQVAGQEGTVGATPFRSTLGGGFSST